MPIDTDKLKIDRDTRDGLAKDNETLGSMEKNLYSPAQKVPSDKYKENYDKISWRKTK